MTGCCLYPGMSRHRQATLPMREPAHLMRCTAASKLPRCQALLTSLSCT